MSREDVSRTIHSMSVVRRLVSCRREQTAERSSFVFRVCRCVRQANFLNLNFLFLIITHTATQWLCPARAAWEIRVRARVRDAVTLVLLQPHEENSEMRTAFVV